MVAMTVGRLRELLADYDDRARVHLVVRTTFSVRAEAYIVDLNALANARELVKQGITLLDENDNRFADDTLFLLAGRGTGPADPRALDEGFV